MRSFAKIANRIHKKVFKNIEAHVQKEDTPSKPSLVLEPLHDRQSWLVPSKQIHFFDRRVVRRLGDAKEEKEDKDIEFLHTFFP